MMIVNLCMTLFKASDEVEKLVSNTVSDAAKTLEENISKNLKQ